MAPRTALWGNCDALPSARSLPNARGVASGKPSGKGSARGAFKPAADVGETPTARHFLASLPSPRGAVAVPDRRRRRPRSAARRSHFRPRIVSDERPRRPRPMKPCGRSRGGGADGRASMKRMIGAGAIFRARDFADGGARGGARSGRRRDRRRRGRGIIGGAVGRGAEARPGAPRPARRSPRKRSGGGRLLLVAGPLPLRYPNGTCCRCSRAIAGKRGRPG